jgi:hypothetical protein
MEYTNYKFPNPLEVSVTDEVIDAVMRVEDSDFFDNPSGANSLTDYFFRSPFEPLKTPKEVFCFATYVIAGGEKEIKFDFGPACIDLYTKHANLYKEVMGVEDYFRKYAPQICQGMVRNAESLLEKKYYLSAEKMAGFAASHAPKGSEEEAAASYLWDECVSIISRKKLPLALQRVREMTKSVKELDYKQDSIIDEKSLLMKRKLTEYVIILRTSPKLQSGPR